MAGAVLAPNEERIMRVIDGPNSELISVRRLARGKYVLRLNSGEIVGIVRHRTGWRADWYAELAIGDEFYNACGATLGEALDDLETSTHHRRAYVLGNGREDSVKWAVRLRRDIKSLSEIAA